MKLSIEWQSDGNTPEFREVCDLFEEIGKQLGARVSYTLREIHTQKATTKFFGFKTKSDIELALSAMTSLVDFKIDDIWACR